MGKGGDGGSGYLSMSGGPLLAIAFDEIATTVQISSPMHDQFHRPGGLEMFVNGKRDSTHASGPVAS